jgi:GTP-binding protein
MTTTMLPVVALVGRPNVGKSTLFNRLTRTRSALVADFPGLTRDRQYGVGKIGSRAYLAMDSGGLTGESAGLEGQVVQQVWQALGEADVVLFLVDGRTGLTPADEDIAQQLRRLQVPLFLVVNKTEHMNLPEVSAEFHDLALGQPHPISAAHDQGVQSLLEEVLGRLPGDESVESDSDAGDAGIRLAIVGRPNVGKSTLVNRLLGEERMLTCDMPGTTRDSVAVPFQRDGQRYTLIDTAGVRRRSRIVEAIEKFSVIKTLQAIEQSHVAVLMLDARQGIAEQDTTLLGHILESGRALVVAVNKWDHLGQEVRDDLRRELGRKLVFLDFAKIHFISALHGSGVMDVLASVRRAYASATRKLATPELTRILADAVLRHQPPLVRGHRIKLRYAHQGGQNPPLLVIHGNRVDHVPEAYRRYLGNIYRKALGLEGTPVRIEFKGGDNPYVSARPGRQTAKSEHGAGRGKVRKR